MAANRLVYQLALRRCLSQYFKFVHAHHPCLTRLSASSTITYGAVPGCEELSHRVGLCVEIFIVRAESTQVEELRVGNAGFGVAVMRGVEKQVRVSISSLLVEHWWSELAMFDGNGDAQEFN